MRGSTQDLIRTHGMRKKIDDLKRTNKRVDVKLTRSPERFEQHQEDVKRTPAVSGYPSDVDLSDDPWTFMLFAIAKCNRATDVPNTDFSFIFEAIFVLFSLA